MRVLYVLYTHNCRTRFWLYSQVFPRLANFGRYVFIVAMVFRREKGAKPSSLSILKKTITCCGSGLLYVRNSTRKSWYQDKDFENGQVATVTRRSKILNGKEVALSVLDDETS